MQAAQKQQDMIITRTRSELSSVIEGWKSQNHKISLVPTMGALHEGHLSLVDIALEKSDRCVVTIFVNPTQYAPHEDFNTYPREEARDVIKLENAGAHLAYLPSIDEIYPNGQTITVKAGKEAQDLEGAFRPGHFDGVTTVVHRLFEHVQPDLAVFGEKDFQQLLVVKEMVKTEKLPVEIVDGPIIRDEYGLALSSRNAYLSDEELRIARKLNKVLSQLSSRLTPDLFRGHGGIFSKIKEGRPLDFARDKGNKKAFEEAKDKLLAAGFTKIDYIEFRWNRLLAAAWIGKTRLIDNVKLL